jgi:hypothetical protein
VLLYTILFSFPTLTGYLQQAKDILVRFQVVTATSVKMTVFWDVAPCGPVEINERVRGAYCLHHQGNDQALMMEAVRTCEILVSLYHTT